MKTLVLYASATGNTELIAKEIVQLLTDKGIVPDIKEFDFDEIRARDLLDYDMILFGVYTWTNGEIPFEVEDFYDDLDVVDLTGKICGVFGSGDMFYDEFCGAVDIMYDRLEELGATMVPAKLKVDLEPDEDDNRICKIFVNKAVEMQNEMIVL